MLLLSVVLHGEPLPRVVISPTSTVNEWYWIVHLLMLLLLRLYMAKRG